MWWSVECRASKEFGTIWRIFLRGRAMPISAYIGKPVSLASLDSMVKDTIRAYRASDRPVVDVLVPEQDITSGVVQLVVVEGRLGAVRVQGAKRDDEEHIRSMIRTEKGEVLYSSEIMGDLAWMNRTPSRRVDLVHARLQVRGDGYHLEDQ